MTNPRDATFMEAIYRSAANDIEGEEDVIGLSTDNMRSVPKGEKYSFIHRATAKANANAASPLLPPAAQASDSMTYEHMTYEHIDESLKEGMPQEDHACR